MEILKLKSTIIEILIKSFLEGLNTRFELVEERIGKLENLLIWLGMPKDRKNKK